MYETLIVAQYRWLSNAAYCVKQQIEVDIARAKEKAFQSRCESINLRYRMSSAPRYRARRDVDVIDVGSSCYE
jgi:hypothetical protein